MTTFSLQAKHHRISQDLNTTVDKITPTEAGTATPTQTGGFGWSPEDLRGIPAIGRSVTGAINGTTPHSHG